VTGQIGGYFVNEIRGFVYKIPTEYWGGYFLKEPSICPVGICQVNCFKTHNELTLYPLGKCPFAPSVKVCRCNNVVVKTASGSGTKEESELEYVSESSKEEEEFRTP